MRLHLLSMLFLALLSATTFAQGPVVHVMPGYPNAPRTLERERAKARPLQPFVVWGSANRGDGSANGMAYVFEFVHGAEVSVLADASGLGGVIVDDEFIAEEVTFMLHGGATSAVVRATLTVDDLLGNTAARSVEIQVVDPSDPSSDTPLERQAIDVEITIDDGLRWLYRQREIDATTRDISWNGRDRCAVTALTLWALQNHGHLPGNDPDQDVYVDTVERGLRWLFRGASIDTLLRAPRADVARGAVADGISDLNRNLLGVRMCAGADEGYKHPIATAAIVASASPDRLVDGLPSTHPLQGRSYREVVEDCIDWLGTFQNVGDDDGLGAWLGRGGWDYESTQRRNRSDMSINSWMYVACEGAEAVFGIDVPDWLKQESDYALNKQQRPGQPFFWYDNGGGGTLATTGGGLSGLALSETAGPFTTPGQLFVIAEQTTNGRDAIAAKRTRALSYLGTNWGANGVNQSFGGGNRGNPYVMWTVARALRLTEASLNRKIELTRGTATFAWESGELGGSGVLAAAGAPEEGYFQFLVRTQDRSSPFDGARGSWSNTWYGTPFMTACAVLVLSPTVFSDSCPDRVRIDIADFEPGADTSLPVGARVLLSGTAFAEAPTRPVRAVLVNGEPADSVDASGRFFELVTMGPGENLFEITAFDRCGSSSTTLRLTGASMSGIDVENLTDVSLAISPQYRNTTFQETHAATIFDVVACNVANFPLDAPLLMVATNFASPRQVSLNQDGFLASGRPFWILAQPGSAELAASGCTNPRRVVIHNPSRERLDFDVQFLAPANRAPDFVTAPSTFGNVGNEYVYDALAIDPDGHPVRYALATRPDGMSVDATSGQVRFTPTAAQANVHQVTLVATDGRGGRAEQRFLLDASDVFRNRPPSIESAPITQSAVGAAFRYRATASDPDRDTLTFRKLSGPSELVVATDGQVDWPFVSAGAHPVSILVEDGRGGEARQSWILSAGTVSNNPNAPRLIGTPPTLTAVSDVFVYQPLAIDPDPQQVLTFRLLRAPLGMQIDARTGRVLWVPGGSQVGPHLVELEVDDGAGGQTTQAWTLEVLVELANRAPYVTSVPALRVEQGLAYGYDVDATDPEDQAVTFELVSGPIGMAIDATSGLLTWTPTASGVFVVALRALDPSGAFGSQVYELEVTPPNQPPTITSTAPSVVSVGAPYRYLLNASDPDLDPLRFDLVRGPNGMSVHPFGGFVTWQTSAGDEGQHPIELRVSDDRGGFDLQSYTLTVEPDTTPPVVTITLDSSSIAVGTELQIRVGATDDVALAERTLTVDGTAVTLDANGRASVLARRIGVVAIHATASDVAGNTGTADLTVQVFDPATGAPGITVGSPAPGTAIRAPTDLIATLAPTQPGQPITWRVVLERQSANRPTRELASGQGPVTMARIATIDPTLLPNDSYVLRIEATEGAVTRTFPFPIDVVGEFKLGNFTYETVDLALPIAGVPLALIRRYDSLDLSSGDFGPGWRLALNIDVSDSPRENTTDTFVSGSTRVWVTRPDGRRVRFTARYQALTPWFPFVGNVHFDPDEGMADSLEILDAQPVFFAQGRMFGGLFSEPYNPSTYEYRTASGIRYVVDELTGLRSIEDADGNTIERTAKGLESSLGVSIDFQRDAAGRIEAIVAPASAGGKNPAPTIRYAYDAAGDLVARIDADGNKTRYVYGDPRAPHYLTRAEDASGLPFLRNVFDADGRLLAQCVGDDIDLSQLPTDPCNPATPPPVGCTMYCLDPSAALQTVFTSRGHRIDLILDAEGNVAIERRYLEDSTFVETRRTYYPNTDWVHTETDPLGNVTRFTRDQAGRVTELSNPQGTWSTRFDDVGRVVTESDPLGTTRSFTKDSQDRIVRVVDELGQVSRIDWAATSGVLAGHASGFTDAVGNAWQMRYDARGLPTGTTDPRNRTYATGYNARGQTLFETDRRGQRVDYTYDDSGRLVRETYADDTPTVVDYEYDAAGRMTKITDAQSEVTFRYWPSGLMQSVETSGPGLPTTRVTYGYPDASGTIQPGYDADGNVTHFMDGAGTLTRYEYDELGQLIAATQQGYGGVTIQEKRVTLDWDAAGNPLRVNRYADAAGLVPVFTTAFEYRTPGNVLQLSAARHRRSADNSVLHDLEFVRDALGRYLSRTDRHGTHTFDYDGKGQLLEADYAPTAAMPDESYAYDAVGNRTASHLSSKYGYGYGAANGSNELRVDDDFTYEYDADGRLIQRLDRQTGESLTIEYDVRGRAVRFETLRQGVFSATTLRYDAMDQLLRTDHDGVIRDYVWESGNPVLVTDGTGAVVRRAFFGLDVDDLVAFDKDGQTYWTIVDEVGSVLDLVRNDASIAARYAYDAFGRLIENSAPAVPNEFWFGAREYVPGVDLLYFRARFYDPDLGRFCSEDPFEPFLYHWPENNPLVFSDPSGMGPLIEYRPILTYIYFGCDAASEIVYVGISKNPVRRASQHGGRGFSSLCVLAGFFARADGRAAEQCLIERFCGPAGAPCKRLLNKINSIAKNSPIRRYYKKICDGLPWISCVELAALGLCLPVGL